MVVVSGIGLCLASATILRAAASGSIGENWKMVDGGGIGGPESAGYPSAPAGFAAVRMCLLGRVQGVGFRPFVVRLATGLELAGWVRNTPDGVVIHLEGPVDRLAAFRERVVREIPPAAEIHAITVEEQQANGYTGFTIRQSERIDDVGGL